MMNAQSVPEFDPLDLEQWQKGVPHDWLSHLRSHDPVHRLDVPTGPPTWLLTRHRDIRAVSREPDTFSSQRERGGIMGFTKEERDLVSMSAPANYLPMMDPPAHTKYRRVVSTAMMPAAVAKLQDAIRSVACRIIDEAVAAGTVELVRGVSAVLPLEAIAELGKIPNPDRTRLFDWANAIAMPDDKEYNPHPGSYEDARRQLMAYCQELYRTRLATPDDDVISRMIRGEIDGVPTTEEQATSFFDILLAAGSETTRNTLSHGVLAFAERPEQYRLLRASPDLLKTSAVEEILRWATPLMYFRRTVMAPVEIGGQAIAAGDGVGLMYISGNRDEEVFPDPFTFDITRPPGMQLAFGGAGPHNCLGAMFARLQIRIFFEELAARVREVRLIREPVRMRSNLINGFKSLHVELKAA